MVRNRRIVMSFVFKTLPRQRSTDGKICSGGTWGRVFWCGLLSHSTEKVTINNSIKHIFYSNYIISSLSLHIYYIYIYYISIIYIILILVIHKHRLSHSNRLFSEDPEVRKTKLAAELANGRLAMVALMAMLFQPHGTAWWMGGWWEAQPLKITNFKK